MRDKTVADAMTPLESVFMLDIQSVIDRKTINEVHKSNIHNVQLHMFHFRKLHVPPACILLLVATSMSLCEGHCPSVDKST